MELEQLRCMLEDEAHRLMDLAKALGKGGRPLNTSERGLVRRVLFGQLEEMQHEQRVAFLSGDEEYLSKISDRILELALTPIMSTPA